MALSLFIQPVSLRGGNLKLFFGLGAAVALAGALFFLLWAKGRSGEGLTLYGNVDIREVQLAFYAEGRIRKILVREGDRVHKGELLAELDASRLIDVVHKAEATVQMDRAALQNAELTYRRAEALARDRYLPVQDRDNAWLALEQAQNRLKADEAALSLARKELEDSKLYAPADGVIEVRILEPGDMVTPQSPVFTLALDHPVWVRAYVPEPDLGKLFPGMQAQILTDSYPGETFPAWVGYISPTAQFTPKNVETPRLRTRLVYEVRVYSCNADHRLRLGMPVTVRIPLDQRSPLSPPCPGE